MFLYVIALVTLMGVYFAAGNVEAMCKRDRKALCAMNMNWLQNFAMLGIFMTTLAATYRAATSRR